MTNLDNEQHSIRDKKFQSEVPKKFSVTDRMPMFRRVISFRILTNFCPQLVAQQTDVFLKLVSLILESDFEPSKISGIMKP